MIKNYNLSNEKIKRLEDNIEKVKKLIPEKSILKYKKITTWTNKNTKKDVDVIEAFAVFNQALKLVYNYHMNNSPILSCLTILKFNIVNYYKYQLERENPP